MVIVGCGSLGPQSRHIARSYENLLPKKEPLPEDIDSLKTMAEKGHAGAQYKVARKYSLGEGVPEDFKIAYAWYKISYANGESGSYRYMKILENGLSLGVVQEVKESVEKMLNDNPDLLKQGVSPSDAIEAHAINLQAKAKEEKSRLAMSNAEELVREAYRTRDSEGVRVNNYWITIKRERNTEKLAAKAEIMRIRFETAKREKNVNDEDVFRTVFYLYQLRLRALGVKIKAIDPF
jgi:hypothetical protein